MARTKFCLQLDGRLCFLLALMLILLPLPWVLGAALAAAVHELFHAVAIFLLKGNIYALHLGAGGIRMETTPMPPDRELMAAIAGPFGSVLLVLLAPWLPRTAACAAIHCVYNLLPLFPLDGGRMLQNLFLLLLPADRAVNAFDILQHIVRVSLWVLCFVAGLRWGFWPAAAGILLLWRQRMARTV